MPIISVEIMKTIDQRKMQKTKKQTKIERSKGNRGYSESVRAKWFCCAFKLGFINWRKPNLNAQQNHLALTFLFSL